MPHPALVVALPVLLLTAEPAPVASTPPTSASRPCEFSTDCVGGDQVCLEKVCRYTCNSGADCQRGPCATTERGYTICAEELELRPGRKTTGWSKAGWDIFRFGMGQDDVLEAAGSGARLVPASAESPSGIDSYFLEGWKPIEIDGIGMSLWFSFLRGRLYEIALLPDWPERAYNDRRIQHFFSLEGLLTEKYGPPTNRSIPKTGTIGDVASGRRPLAVSWAKKGFEITLQTVGSDGDIGVHLNYCDPKPHREAAALFGKRAIDRAAQERDRL